MYVVSPLVTALAVLTAWALRALRVMRRMQTAAGQREWEFLACLALRLVVRTSAKFALNVTSVGYVQATTLHVPAAMGYLTRESSWKRVDVVTQQVALVGLVAAKTKQTCKLPQHGAISRAARNSPQPPCALLRHQTPLPSLRYEHDRSPRDWTRRMLWPRVF